MGNRKQGKDLLNCLLCQRIYKDEYDKLQSQMFRKKILNPITERQIRKKYGSKLTMESVSRGITQQKLHWNMRSCFGSTYRVYEKDEIEELFYNGLVMENSR